MHFSNTFMHIFKYWFHFFKIHFLSYTIKKKLTSDSEGPILLQWKLKFLLISAALGLSSFEKIATLNNAGMILWFYEQWSQTLSNMSSHGWELLTVFTSMCDWEKGKLDKSEQPILIILKKIKYLWKSFGFQ